MLSFIPGSVLKDYLCFRCLADHTQCQGSNWDLLCASALIPVRSLAQEPMLLCSLDLSTGFLCSGSVHPQGWSLSLPWEQDRTIRVLTGHSCLRVAPEGCSINERRHLRCLSQTGHPWGLEACPVPREMGVELMSTDQCLWDLSSFSPPSQLGPLKYFP